MKKIFVSIPMRDKSIDELRDQIFDIFNMYRKQFDEEDFKLIDTLFTDDEPEEVKTHCWYLGKSIMKLAEADLVIFAPDWYNAPGCIIEREVAYKYGIPYKVMGTKPDGSLVFY